jgi:hypothetical protein
VAVPAVELVADVQPGGQVSAWVEGGKNRQVVVNRAGLADDDQRVCAAGRVVEPDCGWLTAQVEHQLLAHVGVELVVVSLRETAGEPVHAVAVANQAMTAKVQLCFTGMQKRSVGETAI